MYNNGSSFKVYKELQRKHRYEPLEHRGTLNGGLCGNGVSSAAHEHVFSPWG